MPAKSSTDHMHVRYVADLARLRLTDEEAELYQGQLNQVLDYVQTLKELDVDDVEPTAHPRPVFNVFREDTPGESQAPDETFGNAPRAADGLILLPRMVE